MVSWYCFLRTLAFPQWRLLYQFSGMDWLTFIVFCLKKMMPTKSRIPQGRSLKIPGSGITSRLPQSINRSKLNNIKTAPTLKQASQTTVMPTSTSIRQMNHNSHFTDKCQMTSITFDKDRSSIDVNVNKKLSAVPDTVVVNSSMQSNSLKKISGVTSSEDCEDNCEVLSVCSMSSSNLKDFSEIPGQQTGQVDIHQEGFVLEQSNQLTHTDLVPEFVSISQQERSSITSTSSSPLHRNGTDSLGCAERTTYSCRTTAFVTECVSGGKHWKSLPTRTIVKQKRIVLPSKLSTTSSASNLEDKIKKSTNTSQKNNRPVTRRSAGNGSGFRTVMNEHSITNATSDGSVDSSSMKISVSTWPVSDITRSGRSSEKKSSDTKFKLSTANSTAKPLTEKEVSLDENYYDLKPKLWQNVRKHQNTNLLKNKRECEETMHNEEANTGSCYSNASGFPLRQINLTTGSNERRKPLYRSPKIARPVTRPPRHHKKTEVINNTGIISLGNDATNQSTMKNVLSAAVEEFRCNGNETMSIAGAGDFMTTVATQQDSLSINAANRKISEDNDGITLEHSSKSSGNSLEGALQSFKPVIHDHLCLTNGDAISNSPLEELEDETMLSFPRSPLPDASIQELNTSALDDLPSLNSTMVVLDFLESIDSTSNSEGEELPISPSSGTPNVVDSLNATFSVLKKEELPISSSSGTPNVVDSLNATFSVLKKGMNGVTERLEAEVMSRSLVENSSSHAEEDSHKLSESTLLNNQFVAHVDEALLEYGNIKVVLHQLYDTLHKEEKQMTKIALENENLRNKNKKLKEEVDTLTKLLEEKQTSVKKTTGNVDSIQNAQVQTDQEVKVWYKTELRSIGVNLQQAINHITTMKEIKRCFDENIQEVETKMMLMLQEIK